jgi:hypothetical protein
MPPAVLKGRARGLIADEQAVVGINSDLSDVVGPDTPVVRVLRADDSLQAHRMCNKANTVLYQQIHRLVSGYPKTRRDGEHWTYINITIGRAPTGRCEASDELDGLDLNQ